MVFIENNTPRTPVQVLPATMIIDDVENGRDYTGTPIISQDFNPVDETGKIKWWQALIAAAISVIAPPFGAIAGGALTAYWSKGAGDNLTSEERSQVDTWIQNVLMPFLAANTNRAAQILQTGITDSDMAELNDVLAKLCIVKTHFATNDMTTFLSEDAIQYRYEIIAELCDAFAKEIADRIASSGLSYRLSPNVTYSGNYGFGNLIPNLAPANFNCFNYRPVAKGAEPTVQTIGELPVSPSTPVKTINVNVQDNGRRKVVFIGGILLLAWGLSEALSSDKKKSNA